MLFGKSSWDDFRANSGVVTASTDIDCRLARAPDHPNLTQLTTAVARG